MQDHFSRLVTCAFFAGSFVLGAQPVGIEQTDFPTSEFTTRRAKVFDQIGKNALALIPSAPSAEGSQVFRQSNEFYYLTGVAVPHSYLFLDGHNRTTAVYLPHRDVAHERQAGARLSADLVKERSGADAPYGVEALGRYLASAQIRLPAPVLYMPFSPAESVSGSRGERLRQIGDDASDLSDGRPSRTGPLLWLLRGRFPTFELRDLSPILDPMRLIKKPREISVIRRASETAALALMEAIRSTKRGMFEYQSDAVARYGYLLNDAEHEGYPSITAGRKNAWFGRYNRNAGRLQHADLVLLDYAPDYHCYTSEVTRMWPVNRKYTKDQRELYRFVLAYRKAPEEALNFRGHLQHPVGMTVHDVGRYRNMPMASGLMIAAAPMPWVPEEQLYVRVEDVVAVTETGVENFTDFLPAQPEDIDKLMPEKDILQLKMHIAPEVSQ